MWPVTFWYTVQKRINYFQIRRTASDKEMETMYLVSISRVLPKQTKKLTEIWYASFQALLIIIIINGLYLAEPCRSLGHPTYQHDGSLTWWHLHMSHRLLVLVTLYYVWFFAQSHRITMQPAMHGPGRHRRTGTRWSIPVSFSFILFFFSLCVPVESVVEAGMHVWSRNQDFPLVASHLDSTMIISRSVN